MCGISYKEYPPGAVGVGHVFTPYPGHGGKNFEFKFATDGPDDGGTQLGLGEGALVAVAHKGKTVLVAAVDGDDRRPGAFRPDENKAIAGHFVLQCPEIFATENGIGGVGEYRVVRKFDAEPLAHHAAAAVAPGEIRRFDRRFAP